MSHWHELERFRRANRKRVDSEFRQAMDSNHRTLRRLRIVALVHFIDVTVIKALSFAFIFHALGIRERDTDQHK